MKTDRAAMHRRAQRAEGDLAKLQVLAEDWRKRWMHWLRRAHDAENRARVAEAIAETLERNALLSAPLTRIIELGKVFPKPSDNRRDA